MTAFPKKLPVLDLRRFAEHHPQREQTLAECARTPARTAFAIGQEVAANCPP